MNTLVPINRQLSDSQPIASFSGLDPILSSLGVLIGLLKKSSDNGYELIPEWFTDPFTATKAGIVKNPTEFNALFQALLGNIGGSSLGIPVQNSEILGNWYPISYEKNGKDHNTGVHVVIYQSGESTVFGLGVFHDWEFGTPVELQASVWGLMPFVAIEPGNVHNPLKITFVNKGFPIVLGAAVNGPDAENPLVNINGIQFNGVKVNVNIDLAASNPFELGVEIVGLQLAGEDNPTNRSLSDLEAITAEQIMDTAASLFVGGLSEMFPSEKDNIAYFPPLFGLSGRVPNVEGAPQATLPILKWYDLFSAAKENKAESLFLDWFNAIASDNQVLKTWLSCFSGFLFNEPLVTGEGSRNTPFNISLLNVDDIGTLNLSIGTEVLGKSSRFLYFGLNFSGTSIELKGSDIQFVMQSEVELLNLQLTGETIGLSTSINFTAQFSLESKKLSEPIASFEAKQQKYSIGSLQGGVSLGMGSKVMPWFGLNAVTIGETHYDTLNLLSPGQLANAGAAALSSGLQSLLDFGTGNQKLGDNLGVIIGLNPPVDDEWPEELLPPFSATGMPGSVTDPIGAWSNYYSNALTYSTPIQGKQAFTYIVGSFASLLQASTDTAPISVTGTGTKTDPWKAGISVKDVTLPAYLIGYQEITDDEVLLTLGAELAPEIEISKTRIVAALELEAATIRFNKNQGLSGATANWLSGVSARLSLPEGFETPAVGGMQVKADSAQLSASWCQNGGWLWSMYVDGPALIIDGTTTALGSDLNFSQQSSLQNLVTQSEATFGPFLLSALGTMLMRSRSKASLFVAGAFGLVKDISVSPVFPGNGLTWSGFELYPFTSFQNPWHDLNQQIERIFSNDEKAKSVLGLLSYAASDHQEAPAITGEGTYIRPWIAPISDSSFNLPVWYSTDNHNLGLGFGRGRVFNYSGSTDAKIRFSLDLRLNLVEYSTELQGVSFINKVPSLMCVGTLSNPDGNLVDLASVGSVGSVLIGFNLNIVNDKLVFEPVVTLIDARLGADYQSDAVTLEQFMREDFASNLQTAFISLLNGAIQSAVKLDSVTKDKGFQDLYGCLELLGLMLSRADDKAPYGINASAWNGLLSDPTGYMERQFFSLLLETDKRKKFFDFFQSVTGITIPQLPTPALQLLVALDICGPQNAGYPLLPQALLEIFSNPVQGLTSRFESLFTDANAVKALAAQISSNLQPEKYGQFTFSSTSNGQVRFAVEEKDSFTLGGLLRLYGDLIFNISDETLILNIYISEPKVGLTLSTNLQLRMSQGKLQTPELTLQLIWGDGLKPAAAPLDIYPFDSSDFVNQVAELTPAYTLNILLNAIFEDQLLEKYEVIQKLFTGLGLAKNENGIWQMPALLGILSDPLDWLLSDEVLGDDGRFSTAKLVAMLGELPAIEYNGMHLEPKEGEGLSLTGLPFNFQADITGVDSLTTFNFSVDTIDIVNNLAALKNLQFAVSLNQDYQPAFSGGLDIEATIPQLKDGFFTHIAYDKGFQLTLSQGSTTKATGLGVQFLPFLGWGTIASQALATGAAIVIQDAVPELIKELRAKYPDTTQAYKFFTAMQTFAEKTELPGLVNNIVDEFSTAIAKGLSGDELLQQLEIKAFNWVKQRFSKQLAPDTADAIVGLLKLVLPEDSLSTTGGIIQYCPGNSLPLKLLIGLNDSNAIGVWAGVDLPDMSLLKMSIAPTGVAYNLNSNELDVSLGIEVVVPIEKLTAPGLSISFDNNQFNFSFDPLANPGNLQQKSNLSIELLPEFFGGKDLDTEVRAWLFNVIKYVLPRYISLLTLNQQKVKSWLEAPLIKDSQITPILLLTATQIVEDENSVYVLRSFDSLIKITPEKFLGSFFFTLLKQQWTLLEFGKKGKVIIGPKKDIKGYYGLLLQAPDLRIKAISNLVFQLGADNTDWITKSTNDTPGFGDKGIGFYIPISKSGDDYSAEFDHFNMVLNNIGFDIVGKNEQPIVDLSRFKLGKVNPRALFEMQFNGTEPIKIDFGAGLTLDDMGISLSPKLISDGGGNNPTAKNVLGSGDKSDDSENTNPGFSVDLGYHDKLWVNLRSNTGNGHDVIVPVQRSFGPLYIENVGLGWKDDRQPPLLDFISSGSFEISGLKAALQGLRVGVPVTNPTDWSRYTIDLDGFAIDYTGGVTIDVGFLKDEIEGVVNYTGVGIVSSAKFSLGALGSYSQITIDGQDSTSMFIFGVLNAPLGGVPAFFIEGVAAGFAYNRSLEIPGIEDVADFPLVKGVAEGSFTEGENPMSALVKLNKVVKPQIGNYWFAAGLKFSSFKLIDTTALLFLSFGKDFVFNLLGVSVATLPPKSKPDLALAYMELALKVTIAPNAGYASAEAQLTSNSFVLAKGVKLTGGFAFYLWFKDIQLKDGTIIPAGDFVLTLGGYHPAFNKPSYYPDVPRLGINWKLEFSVGKVSITGGAYFALCPTAIMSGGYLTIAYDAGPLVAGLDAYANFLLQWKPFYFNVGIGVSVFAGFETSIAGVSIRLVAKLGCQLKLYGPPVFGDIKVDWYVISFTIPIGNQHNNPSTNVLDWPAFEAEFLPSNVTSKVSPKPHASNAMLFAKASRKDSTQQVVKWTVQTGLQQDNNTQEDPDNDQAWELNPIPWKMTVESAVPASQITVEASSTVLVGNQHVGVRPMGKEDALESPMTVTLTDASGKVINLKERNISLIDANNGAPSALWSRDALEIGVAPDSSKMLVKNVLFGLVLNANQYVYNGIVPEFPLKNLEYVSGNTKRLPYAFTPKIAAAPLYPDSEQKKAFSVIMQTIMSDNVIATRNNIYLALQAFNIDASLNPDLSVMASSANLILQDFPVLAKVGIYQNDGIPEPGVPITTESKMFKAATVPPMRFDPQVIAQLQAYNVRTSVAGTENTLAKILKKAKGHWQELGITPKDDQRKMLHTSPATNSHNLYDGTSLVWKINPDQPMSIDVQGNLTILATSFDKYGSLLAFDFYQTGELYDLPQDTERLVVQGYGSKLCDLVGWQTGTQLSKVSGTWLQGDGCLVRVQNSRQITPDKGVIGHVKVSDLIEDNKVISTGADKLNGWVQTVFGEETKIVGILFKGGVSDDAIRVTVTADKIPSTSGETKPVIARNYHGNTLFLYSVPEQVVAYSGTMLSFVDQHVQLLGMFGLSECWSQDDTQKNELELGQVGIDFDISVPNQSQIELIPR